MDLTEIEGLADLLNAETDIQRKLALSQASVRRMAHTVDCISSRSTNTQSTQGSLRKLYSEWRMEIIESLGYIEAYIDFAENDDIEDDVIGLGKR